MALNITDTYVDFSMVLDDDTCWPISGLSSEAKVTYYEELFAKAIIMRAHSRDPQITLSNYTPLIPFIKHAIDWLRTTDFYTAPASTKYHDACYGGLLKHTLQVYEQLVSLRGVQKFKSVVEIQWWSAVFAALVHDWCKIGRYERYFKNVKNSETGEWEQVPGFKYREDTVARFGHGTQSLIMATQLCNTRHTSLTFEEMAAIRWHMDNWDMATYDVEDLHKCNEKIPLVRMIQFADQLAITTY